MKKLFILLLLTSFSYAQDCKFEIKDVDTFTKKSRIETKKQVIAVTTSTSISFSFYHYENDFLKLTLRKSGITSIVVGHESKLLLMLNNDEIITLKPNDIVSGKFDAMNNTSLNVKYLVSISDVNKIKNIGLKNIRFNSTEYYYDFDVNKEKWIKKLNSNIDCFLNEI